MKYVGSKSRIAKEIIKVIKSYCHIDKNTYFIEPFCGGCNLTEHIDCIRVANDINMYLISMFRDLMTGREFRDNYTKMEYDFVKKHKDMDIGLTGYMGFCLSYCGKFLGGFADKSITKEGKIRNYQLEAKKNLYNQKEKLKGVIFTNLDYKDLWIAEKNCVVYCDPPYKNTLKYSTDFNHDEFWEWCRNISKQGTPIFISEYEAPEDFVSIWSKKLSSSLRSNSKTKGAKVSNENLYIYKDFKK